MTMTLFVTPRVTKGRKDGQPDRTLGILGMLIMPTNAGNLEKFDISQNDQNAKVSKDHAA